MLRPAAPNKPEPAPEPAIQFSLVVATLHDDGDLEHCLDSLLHQTDAPPFEVIVVDQNGDDRLNDLLARFSSQLNVVHERVSFRCASRARNLGVQKARGQWISFPDDDCRYFPMLLREVAQTVATLDVRVVTGITTDVNGVPNVLRWRKQAQFFDRKSMFRCLTEATLFVERETFLAAGGFDERFGPGAPFPAAEGIDLMDRVFGVMGTQQRAYFNPTVCMYHPTKIPPWTRWAVRRFYSYACGDGAAIAKNPHPHMLRWGVLTLGSAVLQTLMFRGWRSAAFAARTAGLFKGFFHFHFRGRRHAKNLTQERKCAD